MTGTTLTVALEGGSLRAGLRALQRLGEDTRPVMAAIGAALVETTQARFERGAGPDGVKWAPWSPAYAAVTRSNGVLRGRGMSGGLMGSIHYAAGQREVRVGTDKVYGAIQQFGGTIRPRKGKFLRFTLGERVVFARSVTLPARAYLGFGPADRLAAVGAVRVFLADALAARGE